MPITIHTIWSLIIALLGVILYFSGNGKWSEAGRVMFAMGLLATLMQMGGSHITLGR